jgi:hypothetical protein
MERGEALEKTSSCHCSCSETSENSTNEPTTFPKFDSSFQKNSGCDAQEEPCCGPPTGPQSSSFEVPGYKICDFVTGFKETAAGAIPQVQTQLNWHDRLGTVNVRLGFDRNDYKIAPGLYAVGRPDSSSPVLVTANYKLSFDHLRRQLDKINAWILILDTRGINVWCAAGKRTFSTQELIYRAQTTQLASVVEHRTLILPQLSATGVNGQEVKKGCGFKVVWGPVAASDLSAFLSAGLKADSTMRRVTFNLAERAVLIPVELISLRKYLLVTLLGIFMISGLGADLFSISFAWQRGILTFWAGAAGVAAGTILVPLLLPWLPGKTFALKGGITGLVLGIATTLSMLKNPHISILGALGLILITTSLSSFLAMNFTGSTPYTSPSGVEKEMRKAIPLQLIAAFIAVLLWIGAGFHS